VRAFFLSLHGSFLIISLPLREGLREGVLPLPLWVFPYYLPPFMGGTKGGCTSSPFHPLFYSPPSRGRNLVRLYSPFTGED